MPNTKTVLLLGGEIAVEFGENYSHFWVLNLGNSDILMSVSPGIIPGADGVMLIPAGSGRSSGDLGQANTLYFSGSGKVEITPQHNAVCPFFKRAGKGGDKNPSKNILPHSDGLTYFFDYQTNISSNGWWDTAYKNQIAVNMEYNNEYEAPVPQFTGNNFFLFFNWGISDALTCYCTVKIDSSDNVSKEAAVIAGLTNNEHTKWTGLLDISGIIQMGPSQRYYNTGVPDNRYNILAFTRKDNIFKGYCNGRLCIDQTDNFNNYAEWLCGMYTTTGEFMKYFYKSIAFYENVAQSDTQIIENTAFLAQKYGIQI